MMTHIGLLPDQKLKFQTFKNPRWRTAAILKTKNVVLMDINNSLLKTGNKTANINVKNCSLYILLTATGHSGYVSVVNIAFL